jgi:hypothetical protein
MCERRTGQRGQPKTIRGPETDRQRREKGKHRKWQRNKQRLNTGLEGDD